MGWLSVFHLCFRAPSPSAPAVSFGVGDGDLDYFLLAEAGD